MTRRRFSIFVGTFAAIGTAVGCWALTATSLAAPALKPEPGKVHWSFIKPQHAPEPAVKNAAWARNAIDRFVLAPEAVGRA